MLLLLIVLLIGLLVSINTQNVHKINSILIVLLFLTILLFLNNREQFIGTNEAQFIGIKGPSTMNNLLNLQDKDIQNLEMQYKIVKSLYQKKKDALEGKKVKKIPFENSCKVVSISGAGQKDYSYDSSSGLASKNGEASRTELLELLKKLKQSA